ncbi:hypothetical protein [Streptomyces caeruleatus]|uniref:hypothetical protein n=1 Tax=Streptomyces caeruleatus TaxID=661399 RepID=UPI00131B01E8|nr:hypothetical protein [Streptomyces caeruleatus]
MAKTIPPSGERGQVELEKCADALLEAAGDERWETWPERAETEFGRIAAAYTGMVPLSWAPIVATLPTFDPDLHSRDLHFLMRERPGTEERDHYCELIALLSEAEAVGAEHGSGFTVERRNHPPDACQWTGCRAPLYASQAPRKRGRPRKHCQSGKTGRPATVFSLPGDSSENGESTGTVAEPMPASAEREQNRASVVRLDAYRPELKQAPKPATEPKRSEPLADSNPFRALL